MLSNSVQNALDASGGSSSGSSDGTSSNAVVEQTPKANDEQTGHEGGKDTADLPMRAEADANSTITVGGRGNMDIEAKEEKSPIAGEGGIDTTKASEVSGGGKVVIAEDSNAEMTASEVKIILSLTRDR